MCFFSITKFLPSLGELWGEGDAGEGGGAGEGPGGPGEGLLPACLQVLALNSATVHCSEVQCCRISIT